MIGITRLPVESPDEPDDRLGAAGMLMDRLAGTLASMEDLPDYLDRVCHGVNVAIDGCDAVGVTIVMDDRPRTAAYTTATTLEIDAIQYSVGDGPCLDAFRNGRENLVDLSVAEERWPMFTALADDNGIRSLFAVPLVSSGEAFGALNLYAYAVRAFDHTDVTLVRMAAARAADAIASVVQLVGARELAAQMESAMASRAVIEQAKGVIMGREGVDETTAFEILRHQSQHSNVKVRTVAAQLIRSVLTSEPEPEPDPEPESASESA